jgi:rod shape-determining protein MreC
VARAARFGSRTDVVVLGFVIVLSLVARGLPDNLSEPVGSLLRRTLVAPLVSLQTAAERWRAAWVSHESELAARDSVALRAMEVGALEAENTRLRRLLGLTQQLRWGFVPAEALHNRGQADEYVLTLTAGGNAGVRRFSPVVAPEGLVGMVQTVDPAMSLAIMWAHPDFRASAMTEDESAFGIVAAHLNDGPERYLMELRGVPFRSVLKAGTMVVSSGLGGVYPRGIPIGTILDEVQTPQGWARTYLVRPAVLPPNVSAVMILHPTRGAAGVASVWPKAAPDTARPAAPAAGADTAAAAPAPPRAVSADDSARAAAARAAARRRRQADSARVADSARAAERARRAADSARQTPPPPAPPPPAPPPAAADTAAAVPDSSSTPRRR